MIYAVLAVGYAAFIIIVARLIAIGNPAGDGQN